MNSPLPRLLSDRMRRCLTSGRSYFHSMSGCFQASGLLLLIQFQCRLLEKSQPLAGCSGQTRYHSHLPADTAHYSTPQGSFLDEYRPHHFKTSQSMFSFPDSLRPARGRLARSQRGQATRSATKASGGGGQGAKRSPTSACLPRTTKLSNDRMKGKIALEKREHPRDPQVPELWI